jgi:uncharacterized membrane protein YhaH (DUF805 family)
MPDPGWYDDPQDARGLRWWDGMGWTDRRQPRDAVMPPPASTAYGIPLGGPGGPPSAPTATPPGMPAQGGWDAQPPRGWDAPPPPPPGGFPSAGPSTEWGASPSAVGWPTSAAWPAPPRTFSEAVAVCFQKYAVFRGRASRSEYWFWTLFVTLVTIASTVIVEATFAMATSEALFGLVALLDIGVSLALILPGIAVSVRRLHDIGRSAWNLLWGLLPIIGWIVLLVYTVRPGDPHANAYG